MRNEDKEVFPLKTISENVLGGAINDEYSTFSGICFVKCNKCITFAT
jgi:hypothetical protein